jgi:hypothetical protein
MCVQDTYVSAKQGAGNKGDGQLDPVARSDWDAVAFGKRIPFPFSLLLTAVFFPLLYTGAAVSIPVKYVRRRIVQRSERRFKEQMTASGRYVALAEARASLIRGEGTLIGEYVTAKGPFRLWWTPENIVTISPFPCCVEERPWCCEQDYSEFFSWCASRFTSADSGEARLVGIPEIEKASLRAELKTLRAENRFVCIRSPQTNGSVILAGKR